MTESPVQCENCKEFAVVLIVGNDGHVMRCSNCGSDFCKFTTVEAGGAHYGQGKTTTPWDLQQHMKSSGNAFVDARRADAIKYSFRLKGDKAKLLDDLKKARHCLDVAIIKLAKEPGLS